MTMDTLVSGLETLRTHMDRVEIQGALFFFYVGKGETRIVNLQKKLGVTQGTISRNAKSLMDKGLVSLAEDPNHRAYKLVSLTAKGRRVCDQVEKSTSLVDI